MARNLQYPNEASEKNISGRVFVQFRIDKFGCVDEVVVVRGVHPSLDQEAVRVVSSSPQWIPGIQNGRPVDVQFTFPIVFILSTDVRRTHKF